MIEIDSTWKLLPKHYYQCKNRNTFFNANHTILIKAQISTFYMEIHNLSMKFFRKVLENINQILNQALWPNRDSS